MCQATGDRISVDAEHSAGFELVDSEVDRAEGFEPAPVLDPETGSGCSGFTARSSSRYADVAVASARAGPGGRW